MFRRRLFLQIYLAILASLFAVVVTTMLVFWIAGPERFDRDVYHMTSKLAWLSLAPVEAPPEEQQAKVIMLGEELDIDISLYNAQRELIAVLLEERLGAHQRRRRDAAMGRGPFLETPRRRSRDADHDRGQRTEHPRTASSGSTARSGRSG